MSPGLIFYVLLSLLVAYFGRDRKFGFWAYFALSLILTPVIGFILVLASDKRTAAPATNPDSTTA